MLTVEVGGSSTQAIQFEHRMGGTIVPLDEHRADLWLLAAPGLVKGDRIRGAHHIGWLDVQASSELGMASPPRLSMNDAEAAALGEWWLLGQPRGTLLYIGLGTGIGAAAITDGNIVPVDLSHRVAFGPRRCGGCGRVGCLDAQIGGHALPSPLGDDDVEKHVDTLSAAISQMESVIDLIIVGGGMARRYPGIVTGLSKRLTPTVTASACSANYKSAAPFGLLYRAVPMALVHPSCYRAGTQSVTARSAGRLSRKGSRR